MAVDRLSVTVPDELGAALRALAERSGETVSSLVTEAIAHRLRLAALDVALAEADRRFGPVAAQLVEAAEAELLAARRAGGKPKASPARRAEPSIASGPGRVASARRPASARRHAPSAARR